MPSPRGGNTKDVRSSPMFFWNAQKSAEITGVECSLLGQFHETIEAISSNVKINVNKIGENNKRI